MMTATVVTLLILTTHTLVTSLVVQDSGDSPHEIASLELNEGSGVSIIREGGMVMEKTKPVLLYQGLYMIPLT